MVPEAEANTAKVEAKAIYVMAGGQSGLKALTSLSASAKLGMYM
jgi:hypothetical protein